MEERFSKAEAVRSGFLYQGCGLVTGLASLFEALQQSNLIGNRDQLRRSIKSEATRRRSQSLLVTLPFKSFNRLHYFYISLAELGSILVYILHPKDIQLPKSSLT